MTMMMVVVADDDNDFVCFFLLLLLVGQASERLIAGIEEGKEKQKKK